MISETNNTIFHDFSNLQTTTFVQTSQGRRDTNEDNYLLIVSLQGKKTASFISDDLLQKKDISSWPDDYTRLAVVDGIGGHSGGKEIAREVVRQLTPLPPQKEPAFMKKAMLDLHACLYEQFSKGDARDPGAAVIVADINTVSRQVVLCNVGDCKAYLVHNESWICLTHDHTSTEFLWRDGLIGDDEYEAHNEKKRNSMAQALGYGSIELPLANKMSDFRRCKDIRIDLEIDLLGKENHADVKSFRLQEGEYLLLGSDGMMWEKLIEYYADMISEQEISQAMVNDLIRFAFNEGSKDNMTVAIFK